MAGITTTQTFSDGDTVTAAKLNNIISTASIDADVVTTAKILDANVTLAKMATASVDTGQLVDDAVQNSKMENMAASTVKANATSGSANPTDVAVAANKLLVGTSNSINAVSFTTDLELDAADSAAADIRVAATLIGGKASVTADELDELLIKDATDGALKRATVKTAVQSQVASTGASGACALATAAELIDPSGADANDVVSASTGSSMLVKAWCNFTSNIAIKSTDPVDGQVTVVTSSAFNVAVGNHTKDGTTSTGGVQQTDVGTYKVYFTTPMPNTNYIVIGNGWFAGEDEKAATVGTIVTKNVAYVTFTTAAETTVFPNVGYFQLVVFALG